MKPDTTMRLIGLRNLIFLAITITMVVMMASSVYYKDFFPKEIEKPEEVVFLRNPTYAEAVWFLQHNDISEREYVGEDNKYVCYHFSRDTAKAAEEYGIRCYVVILFEENKDNGHCIVAFETTDYGLQYFNPQNDKNIKPSEWVYG